MGIAYPNEKIADRIFELNEAVKQKRSGQVLLLLEEIFYFSELHPRKWAATLRARLSESERKSVIEALKVYKESGL